jgi:hypothetical protein
MPGTTRGEMFEMPIEDALAILAIDDVALHVTREEFDEMRRAARAVVEAHAADVIRRYASKPDVGLRVVK